MSLWASLTLPLVFLSNKPQKLRKKSNVRELLSQPLNTRLEYQRFHRLFLDLTAKLSSCLQLAGFSISYTYCWLALKQTLS